MATPIEARLTMPTVRRSSRLRRSTAKTKPTEPRRAEGPEMPDRGRKITARTWAAARARALGREYFFAKSPRGRHRNRQRARGIRTK
jgi:hypothetical protein